MAISHVQVILLENELVHTRIQKLLTFMLIVCDQQAID